jgi:hypothetical protein
MIHREGKNVEGKNVEGDNVFLVAGPSRVSKGAFSDSLKKIEGPGNVSHSAPPSPSPPPRVLEHHVSDISKTTQMADELQFPPIPTELSAGAPSGQPRDSSQSTGPNNEGPQLAAPFPDQQCSGYPTVDATQHLIAGNGYLVPTGSNYPQAQPYPQPFFGARPGYLGLNGPSVYQGGNVNVPGVYQSGNANVPGVYQGAIAGGSTNVPGIYQGGNVNGAGVYQGGNMNGFAAYHGGNTNVQGVYADKTGQQYFPNLAGLGAATLPNLPVPPHPQGRPPSRG